MPTICGDRDILCRLLLVFEQSAVNPLDGSVEGIEIAYLHSFRSQPHPQHSLALRALLTRQAQRLEFYASVSSITKARAIPRLPKASKHRRLAFTNSCEMRRNLVTVRVRNLRPQQLRSTEHDVVVEEGSKDSKTSSSTSERKCLHLHSTAKHADHFF